MSTWQIRPTTRRTSKSDRVDIHDDHGRYVAGYVERADALRMIHDPAQIAREAIDLFCDLRGGMIEDSAREAAIAEIVEGCAFDEERFHREREADAAFEAATVGAPLDDLPF